MTYAHAVVWIDQHEAKIIGFGPESSESRHIRHHAGKPAHQDRKDPGSQHPERDGKFYHEVAGALAGLREILIVGPGVAKTELMKHLTAHDPAVARAVQGVESIDHPTEGEILAHARQFFKARDRMIAH